MKNKKITLILSIIISMVTFVHAEPDTSQPTVKEIHEDLRTLKTTMETALNSKDIDTIIKNIDTNVVFTTMNGDVVRGHDGVRQYFQKMMEGDDRIVDSIKSHFEADDLSILYGDNMAVSWGKADDNYKLTSGNQFDIKARWSTTMVRKEGSWKVASFHYSTNIFDNPILSAQRKILIGIAVGGAVLFGLIGFFVGRRKKVK